MEPQNQISASQVNKMPVKLDFKKNWPYIAGAFVVILVGIGAAWLISARTMKSGSSEVAPGAKVTSTEAGVLDPKVKYDTAQGSLQQNGKIRYFID